MGNLCLLQKMVLLLLCLVAKGIQRNSSTR